MFSKFQKHDIHLTEILNLNLALGHNVAATFLPNVLRKCIFSSTLPQDRSVNIQLVNASSKPKKEKMMWNNLKSIAKTWKKEYWISIGLDNSSPPDDKS